MVQIKVFLSNVSEHQESGDEKAEADGEQSEGRAGGPRQQEVWCDRGVAKSDPRDILRPLCNILKPPPPLYTSPVLPRSIS